MEYVTLNNGIKMPKLGYGVYQTAPEDTKRCVLDAIETGYRSIDTAQGISKMSQVLVTRWLNVDCRREEFFLTTKVWITNAGYEKAKASIEESLKKLRTDYLDLLLIHQPFGDYYGTYRAMEEFYKAGKIRAIGVSNFGPDRYLDLEYFSEIKPAVNQVETHVFQQRRLPFDFLLQSDVVVIPKSVHKERMKQNIDVFDFTLTAEDMAAIEALDGGESLFFSHYDPKTVEWFMSIL